MEFTSEKEYGGYLGVNSSGRQWLCDRDYNTLREKGRVDCSIHYIAKGRGYYEHNGKSCEIGQGSLVLYFPRVPHHYFFKKEDGTEMLWSHFSGQALAMLDEIKRDEPLLIEIRDRKQFEQVFDKMITAYYERQGTENRICSGYMLVLLELILRSAARTDVEKGALGDSGLEKVLSDMHVHFSQPIDIKKYASECHLSEDRFIRIFKARMGMPPYRSQLRIRIERAIEMLQNQPINVSECAEIVGFSDAAYFSRIFKKMTGHPPSYYKK